MDIERINFSEFFDYYKKYILVVIITVVLFVTGICVYDLYVKTPVYTTSTTVLLVKNGGEGDTISQSDISLNEKLVSTYRQIIKSKRVLKQVSNELGLQYNYRRLYNEVDITSMKDTEILKITVTDEDARVACEIANKIAEVFNREIKDIYNIDNVSVIDAAEVEKTPSNNNLFKDVALAIMLGFGLSSSVIFVIFYFDDTLRESSYIENIMKAPLVGKIYNDTSKVELIVEEKPNAFTSENIRTLRTNLQFSSIDEEIKTLLVTSSIPSDGKSFISSNLAISFARAGKRVLLVDCDLRKGRQNKIFDIKDRKGLSNLLIGNINKYEDFIMKTKVKNLSIMTCGAFPPNPSELLNSRKNAKLAELLKQKFDIVIYDGAPINGLSDSLIMASLVDKVMLVAAVNNTPKKELKNALDALKNVNANLAGIVVNKIAMGKHKHSGYYYYSHEDQTK